MSKSDTILANFRLFFIALPRFTAMRFQQGTHAKMTFVKVRNRAYLRLTGNTGLREPKTDHWKGLHRWP
jgi:hypothetical protein